MLRLGFVVLLGMLPVDVAVEWEQHLFGDVGTVVVVVVVVVVEEERESVSEEVDDGLLLQVPVDEQLVVWTVQMLMEFVVLAILWLQIHRAS
jgi:hypothetical protein